MDDQNSLSLDGEVAQLNQPISSEKTETQSHISDSTFTVDIDRDSILDRDTDKNLKIDNEGKHYTITTNNIPYTLDSPSLHGKSLVNDESPLLVICDYSRGLISDQSTFKLKVQKSKPRFSRSCRQYLDNIKVLEKYENRAAVGFEKDQYKCFGWGGENGFCYAKSIL